MFPCWTMCRKMPDSFTDVWQTLVTPQGVFFRSYELLFRWDGKTMHVWRPEPKSSFQALSAVRGRIYTAQNGVGLQEIVGDEIRNLPGGDAYKNSIKEYLHPFGDNDILISEREGLLSLYDGQKSTPFPTQADAYLKQHKLYKSLLLKDGSICVTTLTGGAVILGHDGSLRQIIGTADGLLDAGVLSDFQDRDGELWLGTTNGITRVEVASPISFFSRDLALDANSILRIGLCCRRRGVVSRSTTGFRSSRRSGLPWYPSAGPRKVSDCRYSGTVRVKLPTSCWSLPARE